MRKTLVFAIILLVAWQVEGQDAKVIPLSQDDSFSAKETWYDLQDAQKRWDYLQQVLRDKYTVVPEGDRDASNTIVSSSIAGLTAGIWCADQVLGGVMGGSDKFQAEQSARIADCHARQQKEHREHPSMTFRKGWENGFEFTSDFKYIVPKRNEPSKWQPGGPLWMNTVPTAVN